MQPPLPPVLKLISHQELQLQHAHKHTGDSSWRPRLRIFSPDLLLSRQVRVITHANHLCERSLGTLPRLRSRQRTAGEEAEISHIRMSPACFLVAVLHICSGGRDAVSLMVWERCASIIQSSLGKRGSSSSCKGERQRQVRDEPQTLLQ